MCLVSQIYKVVINGDTWKSLEDEAIKKAKQTNHLIKIENIK